MIEKLKDDIKFLLNFTRDMRLPIKGEVPMFYLTGSYEDDLKVYNRVEQIKKDME
jgi:hypothetical protein